MSKLREAAQAVVDRSHWRDHSLLEAIWALRDALAEPDETEAAVLAEREACAKVCEESDIVQFQHCLVLHDDAARTLRNAAADIRARGQE